MLGRSYLSLVYYMEAAAAFARASAVKPEDADLLADYAFALGMANDQRLSGQPKELIDKALKLDLSWRAPRLMRRRTTRKRLVTGNAC